LLNKRLLDDAVRCLIALLPSRAEPAFPPVAQRGVYWSILHPALIAAGEPAPSHISHCGKTEKDQRRIALTEIDTISQRSADLQSD
jgi:hypothetical protein